MLILTRKKGQSIIIDNNIEIMISAIDGDQIKIGINAPKHVAVLRKEVYDSIHESNREAVKGKLDLQQFKRLTKETKK